MGSGAVKSVIVTLTVVSGYLWYSYNFGSMYGGKHYQKKSASAEAKGLLKRYFDLQALRYHINKKYDPKLHESAEFKASTTFLLDFNDDKNISKKCADCTISDAFYKIAAHGIHDGHEVTWTIDSSGKLTPIQE